MIKQGASLLITAAGFLLAAVLAPGESAGEKTVFRGRLFIGSGPTTQGVINVEISVDRTTASTELAGLGPFTPEDDLSRFFDQIRGFKAGDLRYIGASGLRIGFNLAIEQATDKGRRIILLAENQPADPTVSLKKLSDAQIERRLLLVVVLDLDEKDQGEGKIYQDASGTLTSEGRFELGGSRSTPLLITGLRRK